MAAPSENGEQAEPFPEGADGDLQAYYDQDPVYLFHLNIILYFFLFSMNG